MDETVRPFLDRFGQALVERDYAAAANALAPWLGGETELKNAVEAQEAATRDEWDDMDIGEPDGYTLDDNPLSASELRDEGVPLPFDVTDDNFVVWCCVTVQADEGEWALYDLWCAVVRGEGDFRMGYYAVESPD